MNCLGRRRWALGLTACLAWSGIHAVPCRAGEVPDAAVAETPSALHLESAVTWALEHNPEIAAIRQQHGIAAAAVIIARTYPFNPIWDSKVRSNGGPESAGITNRVTNEQWVALELELWGQRKHRQSAALAGLSRTESEVAFQELTLAVRVLRAFDTVLYRRQKLKLLEETVRLNEEAAQTVSKLMEAGRLRGADVILIRSEIDDARSQLAPGRTALVTARFDFRRNLGLIGEEPEVVGTLDARVPPWQGEALREAALADRPDLRARQAAVSEAEARVQLAKADRFGNPVAGPSFEYDSSRIYQIGAQFTVPLPVLNRHPGDIQQREAERQKAALELRQTEVQIQQDVEAALARVRDAQIGVDYYRKQTLPNLEAAMKTMQDLFLKNEPGVDVLRLLDVRRKLIKARDGYLDAQFELRQALADLAAALGDPRIVVSANAPAPP